MKFPLKIALLPVLIFHACICFCAEEITFKFEVPPLPYPPEIGAVTTALPMMEGYPSFPVSAQIAASEQMKGICYVNGSPILPPDDPSNYVECEELTAWKQETHPDISPNPPSIKKVLLYYYMNDDTSTTREPIEMTYDSGTFLATANVPIESGMTNDDSITFYIVAVDHLGNVAAQVPDTSTAPCSPGSAAWDHTLSTPALETCSGVDQYVECSKIKNGTPSSCSSSYTVNDIIGDTCGEPDANGNQTVLAEPEDKVDIHGISAGADGSTFCIRMGLGAPPPPTSDSPPIEGYLLIFFNPDVPDSNPGDTHMENAYAITYAPEAQGSDPTLVRVLWDGDCATNPNTENPLDCKIKAAIPGDPDLQMGYSDGAMIYIVKKSWGSDQLIGSSSKLSQIIAVTGEINLSGDVLFWLVDSTSALGFYHKNQSSYYYPPPPPIIPIAPYNPTATCKNSNNEGNSFVCYGSGPNPTQNTCELSFQPSLDQYLVGKYRIYRALTENEITETNKADYLIAEIAEDGSRNYTYNDVIQQADLNGYPRYYLFTSVSEYDESNETRIYNASKTTCLPEDSDVQRDCGADDCFMITFDPIMEIDWETIDPETGKYKLLPKADLKAELVDADTGSLIAESYTGPDGKATFVVDPSDVTGRALRLQLRVPAADAGGYPCDELDGDCIIYLKEDIDGDELTDGYTVPVSLNLPKPGGGRKEIGNPTCDNEINFDDFKEIKKAYKKKAGQDGFLEWADLDGDGEVNFDDFTILKANYKKKVAGTANSDPTNIFCCPIDPASGNCM